MDEIKDQTVDPTPSGQDLPKGDESNSTETQTITLVEHKKAIEDAIAQYGDKVKREKIDPIATELSTFKSKVTQLEADVEDSATSKDESEKRISELETDLETASEDNLDLKEIQRIKKSLRDLHTKARQDASDGRKANAELKRTLEAEREEHAGEVAEARTAKFEVDVVKVAEGYVDAAGQPIKSERLKALCEKAGQTKKGDIQELADTLWVKKDKAPALVSDSNVTGGGTSGGIPTNMEKFQQWIANMSQSEYEKRKPEIDKVLAEGKIK